MRDLGQRVAGEHKTKTERRVGDVSRLVLVDESMVDATRDGRLLVCFEESQRGEIHTPLLARAPFGKTAGAFAIEREASGLGGDEPPRQPSRAHPPRHGTAEKK